MTAHQAGLKASAISVVVNVTLAATKITVGVIGNAYVLVADGIESIMDVFSSLVVWSALRIAARPPDDTHPYGHGKAESIASAVVALMLMGAAVLIAVQSIREIRTPHHAPAPYTLIVLVVVVALKEAMFRYLRRTGEALGSGALTGDAWHHRSDAITSVAAFVGISVALIGGPGYEIADDCAALAACGVILHNALRLLRPAVNEVMDAAVSGPTERRIRAVAGRVDGVLAVEKCRIRKSGMGLLMDIHIEVDGRLSVSDGHEIAHVVKDDLIAARFGVVDVVVHVEPGVPSAPAGREVS